MRILSGIQPSGAPHLGNYFGAIEQHLSLQTEGDALYFIADYHALTTVHDAARVRELTVDVGATYLALGLDPNKATFFRQSDVPEVTELTWLLSCVTGMGLLERAHSYKDKLANGIKPSVGLFTYPALMAADILIYKSNLVPVGQDQVQHIEIAQDMAQSFNAAFKRD
ncbi:MAG: tryptophan--tRNA ligase, partial [Polyangiaceae bacterium]